MDDIYCKALLKSGKRKGQECGCKVKYPEDNPLYCGRHSINKSSVKATKTIKTNKVFDVNQYIKHRSGENCPKRVCVKAKNIRPEFDNLEEWLNNKDNILCCRNGRVFVNRNVFHYGKSIFHNPYKSNIETTLEECLKNFEEYARNSDNIQNNLKYLSEKNISCYCELNNICHANI